MIASGVSAVGMLQYPPPYWGVNLGSVGDRLISAQAASASAAVRVRSKRFIMCPSWNWVFESRLPGHPSYRTPRGRLMPPGPPPLPVHVWTSLPPCLRSLPGPRSTASVDDAVGRAHLLML